MTNRTTGSTPLIYVYGSTLPNTAANSVQVTSMAQALGGSYSGRVVLQAFKADPTIDENYLRAHYGLKPTFNFELLNWQPPGPFLSLWSCLALFLRYGRKWSCFTRLPLVAALSATLRVRTILELHAPPERIRDRIALAFAARQRRTTLVFISQALRDHVASSWYCGPVKTVVEPDGVHADRVTTPDQIFAWNEPSSEPTVVGYAGSLKADKGVTDLLRAAEQLLEEGQPPLVFVIAGGVPTSELRRLRSTYRHDRIRFLGQLAPSDVPTVLERFDIIVCPFKHGSNRVWRDRWGRSRSSSISQFMSPLKIFEALASGRPLITSDMPVLREVLTPGVDCLMYEAGEVADLADKIRVLATEGDLRFKLAKKGLELVETFTWEQRAERILRDTGLLHNADVAGPDDSTR